MTAPASCTARRPTAWTTSTAAWRTACLDDILNPVQGNGSYAADFPLFGGLNIWKAGARSSSTRCATPAACWPPDHHPQLPALLAPQDAGDLPRRGAVVRAHGRGRGRLHQGQGAARRCARLALDAIEQTGFYPENGKARLRDMIANRPDWCISRQRSWGVPLPFFLHKDTGELHPRTMEILDQAADIVEPAASRPGAKLTAETSWAPRRAALHQEQRHPGGVVRLRHHLHHVLRGRTPAAGTTTAAPRPTCTWKATTSTAAGSTARCCWPAPCTAARPTAAC
jgi:isoleucyl-tRNA synthetase